MHVFSPQQPRPAYRSARRVGALVALALALAMASGLGLRLPQARAHSLAQTLPASEVQPATVQATPALAPLVARYINVQALLQSLYLPPWPPDGSDAARSDLAGVLMAQSTRTADEISEAKFDAVRGPIAWAQDAKALGPGFTAECHPLTTALLLELHDDMRLVNRATNAHWGTRSRPSLVDSRVQPSLADPGANSPSYPSARAASSRVWALLLADVFPHRRESLMSMSERSAQLRLIAGVHFPSDLAAGTLVANASYAWLQGDGDFKRALKAARSESTLRRQC